ncbi:MAG TPA: ribosome-associated translation inhibitor RaiA [Candidatus Limnocylindria bacterium]|nr:ribosome-associated translation inhibitor RaiA [Candidatus Limnocylindria bacterium]
MIQKLEVNGVHMEVSKKLHDYVLKKIGKLDHYMPRHARESAHVEVFLKEVMIKKKKQCICEVVLHLPKETITIQESTMNIFAAVDIVEAKLKNQIKKYKETHSSLRIHRRVLSRLRNKAA